MSNEQVFTNPAALGGTHDLGQGISSSRIALGTMTFGDQVASDTAEEIVRLAMTSGIRMIDTANIYTNGASESMLAPLIAGIRQDIVLASKVGIPHPDSPERPLSRDAVLRDCEQTLLRLGTDYLDIYYLHQPDWNTDIRETLGAFRELIDSGTVKTIGVSNYAAWQIAEINVVLAEMGLPPVIAAQQQYNILSRRLEDEYLAFAHAKGLTTIAYNPLAGGLLTGKYSGQTSPSTEGRFKEERYQQRYWNAPMLTAVDMLQTRARELGIPMASLAFRWLLGRPTVGVVILGVSSVAQMQQNIDYVRGGPLDAETLALCDEAWNQIRGVAPKYNR